MAWSNSPGSTPDRRIASLEACAANSIALTSENAPVYRAIGVRAPATITTSVGNIFSSLSGNRLLTVYSRTPIEYDVLMCALRAERRTDQHASNRIVQIRAKMGITLEPTSNQLLNHSVRKFSL